MLMLHFYVEELSAEAALIELVPRILADYDFDYEIFTFQGKPDLLRKLSNRLKAYQHYPGDDWRVIVLVDLDSEDCMKLKQRLESAVRDAGLETRTSSPTRYRVINRIAIEELEAWFFGDVKAMVTAYPRVDPNLASQAPYRNPDAIVGGTSERLEQLLQHDHPGGLEKIRAASEIAKYMHPSRNRSKSFQVFHEALLALFVT